MIDINCHLLSNIKQPVKNFTESISMARKAAEQGIRFLIATPTLTINDSKDNIINQVKELNIKLKEEGLDITILAGAETTMNDSFVRQVKEKKFIPLNLESPYLLINMSSEEIPHNITEIIFELQILGYQIILANPELNLHFRKNPMELYHLVRQGVLTQISAASIIGKNGWKVQKVTEQLIKRQMTHFIASSAQNDNGLWLEKAYNYIRKHYGSDQALFYMENAQAVIEKNNIYTDQPIKPNSRKLSRYFRG
ncbi:tyrosine-protein phosphatase [Niallia sp. 01092]|uniref:tyrosine-protein phosphatase n=1 Tax=unclassified Niallia TaxID=2837522 RepID=UPI003FD0FA57